MGRKPTGQPRGRRIGSGTLGLGTQDQHQRLTLRIPQALYDRLTAYADGRHYTRGTSQLAGCVREAIEYFLASTHKRQTTNGAQAPEVITGQTINSTPEAEDTTRQTSNGTPALALREPDDRDSVEWRKWAVLRHLTTEDSSSSRDIARAIGWETSQVARDLRELLKEGRVTSPTTGVYARVP